MEYPITTFKKYYLKKYNTKVGKIALDVEVECPNRKKGGCTFCSSASYTPYYLQKGNTISDQLYEGKKYLATRSFEKYFAYFQQETTTAAATSFLLPKFACPLEDDNCVGLIISTRPDYVADDLLESLATLQQKHSKEIIVELGLQSGNDTTLQRINRNHTVAEFVHSVERIHKFGVIETGVHLILGLPGENEEDMIVTAQLIASLGVSHVKFHHLQIIENTPLHIQYMEKPFTVYGPHQYLTLLSEILGYLPRSTVVHRLWSSAPPNMLIEPRWDTPYHELQKYLLDIMAEKAITQGCYYSQ